MVLATDSAHVTEIRSVYTDFRCIVTTSLNMNISVLRYVTPCSWAKHQDRFE